MKTLLSLIVAFTLLLSCIETGDQIAPEINQEESLYWPPCIEEDLSVWDFYYSQFPSYGTEMRVGQYYTFRVKHILPYEKCPSQQQYLEFHVFTPDPGSNCTILPKWIIINGQKFYPKESSQCLAYGVYSTDYKIPIYEHQFNNPNFEFTFVVSFQTFGRYDCTPLFICDVGLSQGPNTSGSIGRIEGGGFFQNGTYSMRGILASSCN